MNNEDKAAIELIKKLINEVKKENANKKVLTEGKTAQQVFQTHKKQIKEYVLEQLQKTLNDAAG